MANEVKVRAYAVNDASPVLKTIRSDADALAGTNSIKTGFGLGIGASVAAKGIDLIQSGIEGLVGGSIDAASNLNETISKVGVVFGDQAKRVLDFGKTSATALGMSQNAALGAAGTYGNLFVSMGMATDKAADMSVGLVKLAGDLASFDNIAPEEALEKLRAGLVGETEPLRALGVNLTAADVAARAVAMGLATSTTNVSAAAKAQASYSLILEQTKTAQGDFARTSDGVANQQRILAAQWEDMQAKIGAGLLPVVKTLFGVFNSVGIPAIGALVDNAGNLSPMILPIAAGIGTALVPALKAMGVAAWEATGPIGAIVIGVSALASAINVISPPVSALDASFRVLRQDVLSNAGHLAELRKAMLDSGFASSEMDKRIAGDAELMKAMGLATDTTTGAIKTQAQAQLDAVKAGEDAAAQRWIVQGQMAEAARATAKAERDAADAAWKAWYDGLQQTVKDVRQSEIDIAGEIRSGRAKIVAAMQQTIADTYDPLVNAAEQSAIKLQIIDLQKQLRNKKLTAAEKAELQIRLLNAQKSYAQLQAEATQYGDNAARIAMLKAKLTSKEIIEGLNSGDEARVKAAKAATKDILDELDKLGGKNGPAYKDGEKTGNAYADGLRAAAAEGKQAAKDYLSALHGVFHAKSPPGPESPLHEIDKWGYRTAMAYADGMAAAGPSAKAKAQGMVGGLVGAFSDVRAGGGSLAAAGGGGTFLIQPTVIVQTLTGTLDASTLEKIRRALGPMIRSEIADAARVSPRTHI